MSKAVFEYKCRRCGVVDLDYQIQVPSGELRARVKLIEAMKGITKSTQAPAIFSLHLCAKGECGISDLIGYHVEENED